MKWAPFALTLFTIPLVSSCSSDDEEEEQQEVKRPISVVVSENPMKEEESGSRITRTENPTTTETLTSFKMMYQADAEIKTEYTAEKTGSPANWGLTPSHWPTTVGDTEKIDFYAYNEGTYIYNDGSPYISFTVASEADSQVDFLVAHSNTSMEDHGGKVPLEFDHACAAVQFYICMTNTVSKNNNIIVKSIDLKNVKNSGRYSYSSTPNWSSLSGSKDYRLNTSAISLTTSYQLLDKKWLFLIPQSKSGISLNLTYTVNGGSDLVMPINLSGTWEAGTQYTINIRVGSSFIPQQQS